MSQLKVNSIVDANGGSAAVLNGTVNGVVIAPNSMGFRNRIINGDMRIDQRNAGASITPAQDQFMVDRWKWGQSQTAKFTAQQSTTAPAGFNNSLLLTVTSAVTVGASDYFTVYQPVEGFNVADLGWGTASAQSVTLSFRVRSSLTGTFGGAIRNASGARSYPFSYTISVANTWTDISVVVPGDTSGTWLTTNGIGLLVNFGLGVGTTLSGTAGAWAGANYLSATGAVSVVGTNGATFYITGVQLEAGSVATPFERRDYGRELIMCQRYYQRTAGSSVAFAEGFTAGALTASYVYFSFPVVMRSAPSATQFNTGVSDNNTYSVGVTGITATSLTSAGGRLTLSHGSTGGATYRPCEFTGSAGGYVDFSAEL